MEMRIRSAQIADLPRIVTIYNQAIEEQTTGYLEPLELADRVPWFENHHPDSYPLWVAEIEDEPVAGWISLSPYRPERAAFRSVAEISYFVDRDQRRKGIASTLMQTTTGEARRLGYANLVAILLQGNQASISLLQKHGFREWGHMPRIAIHAGVEQGHLYYGRRIGP